MTAAATMTPARPTYRCVELMGVGLTAVTEAEAIQIILDHVQAGRGGWVITPNLDILRQAQRDDWLRSAICGADLALADGMPLIWASRLQRTPLPERVAGSGMTIKLAGGAAQRGLNLYLLGGAPGAADAAAARLQEMYPGLNIAGTCCPPMGFDKDPEQMQALRDRLSDSHADLVYVALGCPKQERVIEALRDALPNAWWLGVGISLSFIAGDVARAPRWMQKLGIEWVHRLVQEPGRLAKRYLVHGIPFGLRLCAGSAIRGVCGRNG